MQGQALDQSLDHVHGRARARSARVAMRPARGIPVRYNVNEYRSYTLRSYVLVGIPTRTIRSRILGSYVQFVRVVLSVRTGSSILSPGPRPFSTGADFSFRLNC